MKTDFYHAHTMLLRGGRMTKYKGQAASFAPALGRVLSGVSALAIGATVTLGGAAQAGSCTDQGGNNFVCSGPAGVAGTDSGLDVRNFGTPVTVTTAPGFGVDSSGNGFQLTGGGVTFTDANNSQITANGDGIRARGPNGISITTNGTISAGQTGILVGTANSGGILIDVADVTASNGTGIDAFGSFGGTDLSISSSGTISGNNGGINADNDGTGALTIDVADVTSATGAGVAANNSSAGTDLSITASGAVNSSSGGVVALNSGSGDLSVEVADVTSATSNGIFALNENGPDLYITSTGHVQGAGNGIDAELRGTGDLTVDVVDVTSTSNFGVHLEVEEYGRNVELTSSGTIAGVRAGVFVNHNGTGRADITVADVVATSRTGVFVANQTYGTDLTITATGTVQGADSGIFGNHFGSGDLTIDAVDVIGNGPAIEASSTSDAANMTIRTTGDVNGGFRGIRARHSGSGAVVIDTADVTSTGGKGIDVSTRETATSLSISSSGVITGEDEGIYADHDGTGALTIDVVDVTSTEDHGIVVNTGGFGVSLADARPPSSNGAAAPMAAMDPAPSVPQNGDLSITATGLIKAHLNGIEVDHDGTGAVTINVGDIEAGDGDGSGSGSESGISAEATGTDVTITSSGRIEAEDIGISVEHYGSGTVTISAADVAGGGFAAIAAQSSGTGISITTTGDVSGGEVGIFAINDRSGTTQITVSGGVTSDGAAIATETIGMVVAKAANPVMGGSVTNVIDLLDGAQVQSSSADEAIVDDDGDTSVYLRAGSALAGSVSLAGGTDSLTIEGGSDFSQASLFDAGAGADDALIFSGFTGAFQSSKFTNFETLTATDSGTLTLNSADVTGYQMIEVKDGATIAAQNADFAFGNAFRVGAGGTFQAGASGLGTVSLSQDVVNQGRISLADGAAGDRLALGGNLTGGGVFGLDVNLTDGTNDQVQIAGDSTGANHGLEVATIGSTVDTAQTFTLVTVAGNSSERDFRLVNADFVTNDGAQAISDGAISYRLEYDAGAGHFVLNPFTGVRGGTVNDNPGGDFLAAGVQQFSDQMTFGTTLQRALTATQRGSSDVNTVSRALSELASTTRPLAWVQGEGRRDSYTVDGRDVETNSGGLRFGAALPLSEMGSGTLVGGIEFGISSLSTDVTTSLTRADISTDAYDATLSALWIANSQLYVDGQLRYGYFDGDIQPNGGQSVDTDSDGYGLSIEVGKPFGLANGLTLVPQVQLMYSDIDTDDVVDLAGGGQAGSLVDGDTLTARFGLRAEHTLAGNAVLFGQVDYYRAFDNETAVAFGQNTILTERGKNTAALTVGGHLPLSATTTLFGEVTGETGFGSNASDYAFGGNLGVELRF